MKYGLNKKYSRNFWTGISSCPRSLVSTRYELILVPRDEDEHDEAAMEKAWKTVQKDLI